MKAIVLAAGVGKRFGKRTRVLPKCLIPLDSAKNNLLRRYLDAFRACGIQNIVLVVGHQKEKIKKECARSGAGLHIRFVENKKYTQGSVLSLYTASKEINDDILVMDADVYFPVEALAKLLNAKQKSAFLADTRSKSSGEEMMLMSKHGRLEAIAKKTDPSLHIVGEATGIVKFQKKDAALLKKILSDFVKEKNVNVEYEDAYVRLMKKRKLAVVNIGNIFWSEMDFEADLKKIRQFSRTRPTPRNQSRSK